MTRYSFHYFGDRQHYIPSHISPHYSVLLDKGFVFPGQPIENNEKPKKSRLDHNDDFWTRYNKPNRENAVEAYYQISKENNLDMAQMSLKFCEIQPFVTSVIIGATTMEQLKTNIESVNVNLSDEIIKEINEIQKIYPNPCP